MKVAADLTGHRRVRRGDDAVPPNATVAQDGHLVPRGKEVVRHFSVDHDHVARCAHAAPDLPADRDALTGGDHIAGHAAIDRDVVAGRDQVAVDRSVDRDVRPEGIEVILDRFGRGDRDVLTLADVRGCGDARRERKDQDNEKEEAERTHAGSLTKCQREHANHHRGCPDAATHEVTLREHASTEDGSDENADLACRRHV